MEKEIYHILPVNDSDHHSECGDCKCSPRIEELSDRVLIVHNSFDGREVVELANEILSSNNNSL
jgi:predicted CoA-binding protein